MASCPYCCEREADTDDEIFAQFLGGRRSIRACRTCNSTFGHSIEADASMSLGNIMFLLRLSGMPTPTPRVWKKVPVGEGGELYDIDQDLKAQPSTPTMVRNDAQQVVGARGALHHVRDVQKSLARDGKESAIATADPVTVHIPVWRHQFPTDDAVRRVCIKMSVAAATKQGLSNILGTAARAYLRKGEAPGLCPVRLDVNLYPILEQQRPPAGHLVFVCASKAERRVYSIVQLFSAFQFYCELSDDWEGEARAILAAHDPVTHQETFAEVAPLDLVVPLQHLPGTPARANRLRLEQLTREVQKLYGEEAASSFWPAD